MHSGLHDARVSYKRETLMLSSGLRIVNQTNTMACLTKMGFSNQTGVGFHLVMFCQNRDSKRPVHAQNFLTF